MTTRVYSPILPFKRNVYAFSVRNIRDAVLETGAINRMPCEKGAK